VAGGQQLGDPVPGGVRTRMPVEKDNRRTLTAMANPKFDITDGDAP
jgi:hypothetical protein